MSKTKTYISEDVLEEFYSALAEYSLDHVERAMYLEGHLAASDVFKPRTKRDWE